MLELEQFCNSNQIGITCVAEHWLLAAEVDQDITFKEIKFEQFSEELHSELCCIILVEQNMFVTSLYRSLQGIEYFSKS